MQQTFNSTKALAAALASSAVIGAAALIASQPAHAERVIVKLPPTQPCQWVSIGGFPVLRCAA